MMGPKRKRETAYAMLDRVAQIVDKDERRAALRNLAANYKIIALTIQYAYHPDVKFDLPEGALNPSLFQPASHDDFGVYFRNVRKLHNFWTSSPVPRVKKEANFIGLCCDVTAGDAKILIAMKDKKLPWKTLNKSFCYKAIPELFPTADVEEMEPEE